MGMIFDTITELAKLNRNPANGSELMATEVAGTYYTYDADHKPTEHKSLRELEGSEDWIAVEVDVIGFEEPEYQSFRIYYKEPDTSTLADKIVAVYPHKVKTASGKIVHLAS